MNNIQKEAAFYKAALLQTLGKTEYPPYLPYEIEVSKTVYGDCPFTFLQITPGRYVCKSNRFGAVSVKTDSGKYLGLKPGEYKILSWIKNKIEDNHENINSL